MMGLTNKNGDFVELFVRFYGMLMDVMGNIRLRFQPTM